METASHENGAAPGLVSARLGVGSWIILIVLVLLLAATMAVVYLGWTLANGTDVPASAYVAMIIGVLIALGVGFGLMALIFYSSRKGYDEPPVLISARGDGDQSDISSD
jgi:mannitol-specific phosphotransferase system IIBC component